MVKVQFSPRTTLDRDFQMGVFLQMLGKSQTWVRVFQLLHKLRREQGDSKHPTNPRAHKMRVFLTALADEDTPYHVPITTPPPNKVPPENCTLQYQDSQYLFIMYKTLKTDTFL